MIDFHLVRLPTRIELFAIANLSFDNLCIRTKSGREIRKMLNPCPIRNYELRGCKLSKSEFAIFNNFFQSRAGRKYSFLFKDHADFEVKKQKIKLDNNINGIITLEKIYYDPIKSYHRPIFLPVINSVRIYQNNQLVVGKFVQKANKITLHSSLRKKSELTISFDFYVPVRFHQDSFRYQFNDDGTISLIDVVLVEVNE